MTVFRVIVCVFVMLLCLAFCLQQNTMSPAGFFTTLLAIFFSALIVGFIWPLSPDESESDDGE